MKYKIHDLYSRWFVFLSFDKVQLMLLLNSFYLTSLSSTCWYPQSNPPTLLCLTYCTPSLSRVVDRSWTNHRMKWSHHHCIGFQAPTSYHQHIAQRISLRFHTHKHLSRAFCCSCTLQHSFLWFIQSIFLDYYQQFTSINKLPILVEFSFIDILNFILPPFHSSLNFMPLIVRACKLVTIFYVHLLTLSVE